MRRVITNIIQLGLGNYIAETKSGALVRISYNGRNLTFLYQEEFEDLSFSIEKPGLNGIWEFLNVANYTLDPECTVTLLQPEGPGV